VTATERLIATERLRLRAARADDAPAILELMRDPAVDLWNPAQSVVDATTAAAWCEDIADWSAGDHATWIVAARDSDAPLGVVSVHRIDVVQADAEIGYRTMPRVRGRGIATEAVGAATAWAFTHLGLFRIELVHAVGNAASCVVALRAGYPLEGVTRQSFTYGDGKRHDEHLHARLAVDPPVTGRR
jgi:RimJ/RimL family protein N-acetyltransferase